MGLHAGGAHQDFVGLLLANKADINARDNNAATQYLLAGTADTLKELSSTGG